MKGQLRADLPPDLIAHVQSVVAAIRAGELGPERHAEVVALVGKLTETSMEWFFIRPLADLGVSLPLRGAIKLGVTSAVRAIRMGLGRVIPKIRADRWARIADYLEQAVCSTDSGADPD